MYGRLETYMGASRNCLRKCSFSTRSTNNRNLFLAEQAKTATWTKHSGCDGAKANSSGCTCALARARHVLDKLSPRFGSCVQLVNRSQRTYLALPRRFCHEHLPDFDQAVVFVGEDGKKFRVAYCSGTCRFSVGWKRFYDAYNLVEGDALVFLVIDAEHFKFKVYVVRSCRPKKAYQAVRNPKVGVSIDNGIEAASIGMARVKEENMDDFLQEDGHREHGTQPRNLERTPPPRRSEGAAIKFQDVKRFEDFKIHVDGQLLDSELSVQTKMKYYELCLSLKVFLHDGLMEGLGSKLVAGVISKTSDIASAITSARLAPFPPLRDLQSWDKALIAFEELGMSVGFMRARIAKLVQISRACETVNGSWSAKWAAVEETDRALKEKVSTMDALLESIETLKASKRSVEEEMNAFEEEVGDLDSEFSLVAAAPWS
ncbi:B3 domain-containing protein Os01g0234100-like [Henckelia pumila]|uniref:B3 domain-containing protein Os01g0234100-like n=1 Tax=Henckelia pumila TaxID=405737 RepID=UPI003C6E3437